MDEVKEEFLDEFLETILTFEKFDNIFKEKLPKDLSKYIYDLVEPYCKKCEKCCKLCLYYCSIGCLRYNNRDVCVRFELNEEIKKYQETNNRLSTIEVIIQRNLQNINNNNNDEYDSHNDNNENIQYIEVTDSDDSLDIQ